ncbi:chitin-binding protein [Streptomyces sp. P9-2B-2]|uniref:chitin-binding protein n=1 Tax=Streptomyces TaxID=1883 RepID=UPI00225196C6|nr:MULTISPECIES: chitin-binding protein [Streptomyces]MCX4639809.1 chitin-binding protein [Streptomyces platensis]WJY39625.1 chitin-binding protein [Streptomyces sp. P9-2B-2]
MRRKIAFLGALALTGGLVAFAPSGAHAITGVITYHTRPDNRPHEILDPGDDHCYGVGDGYGEVDNDTPTDLVLYNGRDCTGSVVTVVRARGWLTARFGSLQLSSDGPREEVPSADEDRPEDPDRSDNPDRSDDRDPAADDRDPAANDRDPADNDRDPATNDRPNRSDGQDPADRPDRSDTRDSSGSSDPSDDLDHSDHPGDTQDPDRSEDRDRPASSASPVDPVNAGTPGRHGRPGRPGVAG